MLTMYWSEPQWLFKCAMSQSIFRRQRVNIKNMLCKRIPHRYNAFLRRSKCLKVRTKIMEKFEDEKRMTITYEYKPTLEAYLGFEGRVQLVMQVLKLILRASKKNRCLKFKLLAQFGLKLFESPILGSNDDIDGLHPILSNVMGQFITDLNGIQHYPFIHYQTLIVDFYYE